MVQFKVLNNFMNYTSSQVVQHTTTFKAWLDVYNKKFADDLFAWHKFNFNSPRRSSLIALCKPLETFPWNTSIMSSVESSIFAIHKNESSCSLVRWKTQMSEHCLYIGIDSVHINYLWLVKHRPILFYNFQDLTFQDFSAHEGPGDFSSVLLEFTNRLKSHVTLIDNILCWARKGFWGNILLWVRVATLPGKIWKNNPN